MIEFIVSQFHSLYIWIDDLTSMSTSHRKLTRRWWQRWELERPDDKSYLETYTKIREESDLTIFTKIFASASSIQEVTQEFVSIGFPNENISDLKSVFDYFNEVFDLKWKEGGYLNEKIPMYEKRLIKVKLPQLLEDIRNFYGLTQDNFPKIPLKVNLILTPSKRIQCGHKGDMIYIRAPNLRDNEVWADLELTKIFREITRKFAEQALAHSTVREELGISAELMDILAHGVVYALSSKGISEQYLRIDQKLELELAYVVRKMRKDKEGNLEKKAKMIFLGINLGPLTVLYWKRKKQIDVEFWKRCIKTWEILPKDIPDKMYRQDD